MTGVQKNLLRVLLKENEVSLSDDIEFKTIIEGEENIYRFSDDGSVTRYADKAYEIIPGRG